MSATHSRPECLALALALGSCLFAAPASAAEPPALTRAEALRQGASRNLGLLSRRLEVRRLALAAKAAWGPYVPALQLDAGYARPEADAFGREHVLGYSAGVAWETPLGTSVAAKVGMNQGLGGPSPASGSLHEGSLGLSVVQPLLKDAWLGGAALPLREADLTERLQRELFRDELNLLLADLDAAYWDLAVAQADLSIKTRSRDRAKEQYEDTRENIRRGILADTEIYVVEENVVFFEQELLRAEEALRLARRRLADLMLEPKDAVLSVADALTGSAPALPERAAAVDEALRQSPRLSAQALRRALAGERQAFAANQSLPSLALTASLALRGDDPEYGEAWGKLVSSPGVDARVGLAFALPLDRSPLLAAAEAGRVEAERQDVELRAQEQRTRTEVENGLADLSANLRLLALASKSVELAELKLTAQVEKYKSGISTLADVVRFQRDLDNALIGLQRTARAVRVAHARLLASQGVLARTLGVEVR